MRPGHSIVTPSGGTHRRWTTSTSAASPTGLSARAAWGRQTAVHSRRICASTAVCGLPKTVAFFGVPSPVRAADRFGAALGARWRPLELPPGLDLNDLGRRPDGRRQFFRLVAEARRELEAIRRLREGTF